MWQKPYLHFFPEEWVRQFVLFSFLPSRYDCFSYFIVHNNGSAFTGDETVGPYLVEVDERQYKAIGKPGAEFLHYVQGEARPPRSFFVEESHSGIKADAFEG